MSAATRTKKRSQRQGRRKARSAVRLSVKELLTVADLIERLGLSRASGYSLARQLGRRLTGSRRGKLVVSRQVLYEWLRNCGADGAS